MRVAITVPERMMPKKDEENPCPCQDRPVELTVEKGVLCWFCAVGEAVTEGQVICEGEVDKKVLEFPAPCDGVLVEQTIAEEEVFRAGDILGYLETADS